MKKKMTSRDKVILLCWIIIIRIDYCLTNVSNFLCARLKLFWFRVWVRKDEFDNSLFLDIEGEEGKKIRKELLARLNQQKRSTALAVIDAFALEKDVRACTRYLVPYPPAGYRAWYLDVFLDELNISFVYSGFFVRKWRNKYIT